MYTYVYTYVYLHKVMYFGLLFFQFGRMGFQSYKKFFLLKLKNRSEKLAKSISKLFFAFCTWYIYISMISATLIQSLVVRGTGCVIQIDTLSFFQGSNVRSVFLQLNCQLYAKKNNNITFLR